MAFIHTTPAAEATDAVQAMYRRQQDAWGYVPNYAKVFSHRPEVMERWGRLLAAIRRPLDARRFELVTLAAAHALKNSYCSLAHGKALAEHFSTDDIRAIAAERDVGALTDAEVAMVRFARKLARDAASITAGDVAALRRHGYADEEIFDIVATVAARSFFTKLLDGLGAEPDAPFGEMEPELRRALRVGRPIGFREPERLD